MCGIIGVAADPRVRGVARIVKRGLEKLEYRGYDSVGVASIASGSILVKKGKGKIREVDGRLDLGALPGSVVIGHTRWATHGAPSDRNAHPHTDCTGRVAVVHNGIIQNYLELREELARRGHVFRSDTDTEVVAHLIEEGLARGLDPYEAFKEAVKRLRGSYALAAIVATAPDRIFFARKDSPLVIGLSDSMNFVASDIPAFLEHTNRVIVVRDYEVGYITPRTVYIERLGGGPVPISSRVRVIDWTPEMAQKGGYPHFMIKEIHEQPLALKNTLSGVRDDVAAAASAVLSARRVFVTAAGTSYHAALVFDYLLNTIAGMPSLPFISSEYAKYSRAVGEGDLLIAVSQSGETIDTLMAVREFKRRGARAIAVSNVVDSAIPRECDASIYTRAGPEIGVAATKTFTTQVLALSMLAAEVARAVGALGEGEYAEYMRGLERVPREAGRVISEYEGWARRLSEELAEKANMYYLGRGVGVPVAMEGALKMKEIAYIHAEAYPAGESKHGPIALVEEGFPVVFLAFNDGLARHVLGNVEEMRARGAYTIGLVPPGARELIERLDEHAVMPDLHIGAAPIVYVIPLQLLAYYTAVRRGCDPDKPRNLAKTVTVE